MANKLDNFLDSEGKLTQFPSKRKLKIEALIYLSAKFEKGKTFSEKEINDVLNNWHTFGDPVTIRRELVNYKFLGRDTYGKSYWLEENQPVFED